MIMAKNIFREPLEPIEGVQDFSPEASKGRINRLRISERKRFCVVKEERPSFISPRDWNQVWSIQRKDKMKILGKKCVK